MISLEKAKLESKRLGLNKEETLSLFFSNCIPDFNNEDAIAVGLVCISIFAILDIFRKCDFTNRGIP